MMMLNVIGFPFMVILVMLLVLGTSIIWIWGLIDCLTSDKNSIDKLIWGLIIFFLNFIGALLYFILGKANNRNFVDTKNMKIRRSSKNKMLFGVCGGLGEYFKTDPTLIRLLWIAVTIISAGFGIIAYLIAAIVIPSQEEVTKNKKSQGSEPRKDKKAARNWLIVGLLFVALFLFIVVGGVLMFANFTTQTSGMARIHISDEELRIGDSFVIDGGGMRTKDRIIISDPSVKQIEYAEEHVRSTVETMILNSYNYRTYGGHGLYMVSKRIADKDDCVVYDRDPYNVAVYHGECYEFTHRFFIESDELTHVKGFEVNTIIAGDNIKKIGYSEITREFGDDCEKKLSENETYLAKEDFLETKEKLLREAVERYENASSDIREQIESLHEERSDLIKTEYIDSSIQPEKLTIEDREDVSVVDEELKPLVDQLDELKQNSGYAEALEDFHTVRDEIYSLKVDICSEVPPVSPVAVSPEVSPDEAMENYNS